MKRLLLPLLAALALPTAVNAGYKADIDLMTDKNEIMVWIQSENFVKNVLKQEAPVGIVIQCGSELTIAGLQTGNVMEGSSTSVRIRWDGSKPIEENWRVDSDGKKSHPKIQMNSFKN